MNDTFATWLPALLAAAGVVAMAAIGGRLTDIGPWYASLKFPAWKPPNWAFGPIWTVVLTCVAIGIAITWTATPGGTPRVLLVLALLVNGVLNVLWNYLFFKRRRPDLALIEIVGLWLSILVIVALASQHSATGAALMLPYLLWVGIAAVLNLSIVLLNAPFRLPGTSP